MYKDQPYGDRMHKQRTVIQSNGTLHVATHTYVHVHVRAALLYVRYEETFIWETRSCKECFGNNAGGKLREWYRSSVTQKCTQLNGIDHVHGTKCGVRVCHHHQTGLLCATCTVRECCAYEYVIQWCTGLCTQQFKCVHKCMRLCEPAWVHVHVLCVS